MFFVFSTTIQGEELSIAGVKAGMTSRSATIARANTIFIAGPMYRTCVTLWIITVSVCESTLFRCTNDLLHRIFFFFYVALCHINLNLNTKLISKL